MSTTYQDRPISALLALRDHGWTINHHEGIALLALLDEGATTMSDLSKMIPLSRAAMTAMTDRLEFHGLVQRVPDIKDRRRVHLHLTEEGGRVVSEALQGGDDAAV